MNTSLYQLFKLYVLTFFNLSKDAMHIHIGLVVFFIWTLIFRKSISSLKTLIPVLIVSLVMEAFDLRDDLNSFGHFRWSASFHDLLNTLLWPAFIVLIFKFRLTKSK